LAVTGVTEAMTVPTPSSEFVGCQLQLSDRSASGLFSVENGYAVNKAARYPVCVFFPRTACYAKTSDAPIVPQTLKVWTGS